ncbi:MAG: long-chain fatty acid--CoA ligase [Candidatus Aminicenantes bacterium]|nr:long-chain fatty acid--CoA ligase [Candidatus Aminicenantes bacterium]
MIEHLTTLSRMFLRTCERYPKQDLLLAKRDSLYRPIATAEFKNRVRELSLGLGELGLKPGDKVVILSENRPEWIMTDFAVLCAGGVSVPIYTSLLPEQIAYIIADAEAKIVVCSNRELWLKVETVRGRLPSLAHVVMIEEEEPEGVWGFAEVAARGRRKADANPEMFERAAEAVRPGDLASIIYTSGTTGTPRGVMLSHANFCSNIESLAASIDFNHTDTALSFLPLSHVLERTGTFFLLAVGASIAYAERVETMSENIYEVKPTIVIGVPRFFEKIYAKVMDNVLASSALKRRIFFWAVKVGKDWANRTVDGRPIPRRLKAARGLARRLVYRKIVNRTGGRVRYFICGGAPLSKDLAEFFFAMGLFILPGYGLTETAPVLTANLLGRYRFGTVGKTLPNVDLRIEPDGEILARGPNIMVGYYKNEAETKAVLQDGWLSTGDIGFLDGDGFLTITDRKKDLIVTSGGKNVAPQPIEMLLQANPYIQSAVVVGAARKFISALIVPDFEKLEGYARANAIPFQNRSELCRREEIIAFLLAEVQRSTPKLASYERVKKIAVLERDFELEAGEITPTLKIRRTIVEEKYKPLIDALYAEP